MFVGIKYVDYRFWFYWLEDEIIRLNYWGLFF